MTRKQAHSGIKITALITDGNVVAVSVCFVMCNMLRPAFGNMLTNMQMAK